MAKNSDGIFGQNFSEKIIFILFPVAIIFAKPRRCGDDLGGQCLYSIHNSHPVGPAQWRCGLLSRGFAIPSNATLSVGVVRYPQTLLYRARTQAPRGLRDTQAAPITLNRHRLSFQTRRVVDACKSVCFAPCPPHIQVRGVVPRYNLSITHIAAHTK